MDLQLRNECRDLLTKLKLSQKTIKETLSSSSLLDGHSQQNSGTVPSEFGKDITGSVNVSKDANTDLKPTYARNKLLTLCKSHTDNTTSMSVSKSKDKENTNASVIDSVSEQIYDENSSYYSSNAKIHNNVVKDLNPTFTSDSDAVTLGISSTTTASPTRLRRRQIINKHTAVPSKLNPEELRELDDERLLNFNYSNISVDNKGDIKSVTVTDPKVSKRKLMEDTNVEEKTDSKPSVEEAVSFQKNLKDQGNDRRFKSWLKKTSMEPKTILNSRDYYSLVKKRNPSKVRFDSADGENVPVADQRLLGYDWIAALLDNEQNKVDQSESFFDDICDFRKAFKDECDNKFYMESPYTLVDREPEPVVEALTEPKVRPYVVNERLFTEPLTSNLIDYDSDADTKKSPSREPTKTNPRFVRVSIPRSTLQTPYRVKPHRRGSFDGSDSCALMDHCLLGWENTVPNLMPPAKSLSLAADAGTQLTSQTTTLAEAERLATRSNQVEWHLTRPTSQAHILPRWRKHFMDTTLNLNLTMPSGSLHNSTASGLNQSSASVSGKRKTDKILQATYSTMYEMERLKKERQLES